MKRLVLPVVVALTISSCDNQIVETNLGKENQLKKIEFDLRYITRSLDKNVMQLKRMNENRSDSMLIHMSGYFNVVADLVNKRSGGMDVDSGYLVNAEGDEWRQVFQEIDFESNLLGELAQVPGLPKEVKKGFADAVKSDVKLWNEEGYGNCGVLIGLRVLQYDLLTYIVGIEE